MPSLRVCGKVSVKGGECGGMARYFVLPLLK